MRPLLIFLLTMVAIPAFAKVPRVVVSLKPIHGLVSDVMMGVGLPHLLLRGSGDPHSHALLPSEARTLTEAEIVFWIGPSLETFLLKPLLNLSSGSRVVGLMQNLKMHRLKQRRGGVWGVNNHDNTLDGQIDPHIWLDPRNAQVIVQQIADVLSEIDPDNAAIYIDNGTRIRKELVRLESDIHELLQPVRDLPFFVLHDAYQYFNFRFKTKNKGAIALDHKYKPGAQRILKIRRRLRLGQVRCLFQDAGFDNKIVATMIEDTFTRVGVLDPVGQKVRPGPGAYSRILSNLANNLKICLAHSIKR